MSWLTKAAKAIASPFTALAEGSAAGVGDIVNSTLNALGIPTVGDFLTGQTATQVQLDAQSALASQQYGYNKSLQQDAQNFNQNEAWKNRDWETIMSNTAYQRARADAEAAGFNPLIALTGQASSPSVSPASSTSASVGLGSVGGKAGSFGDLMSVVGSFGNLVKLGSDIRKVQNSSALDLAHAHLLDEQAKKTDLEARSIDPEAKKKLDRHPGTLGQAFNVASAISRDASNSAREQMDNVKELGKQILVGDKSTWSEDKRSPSGLKFDPSIGRFRMAD